MVFTKTLIEPNQNILVTAAGSGVGVYSVQFALLQSRNVYGIAGGKKKLDKLKKLGIKKAFNTQDKDWLNNLTRNFNKTGIDLLIDTVGGETLQKIIPHISPEGTIVFCGATENPQIKLNLVDIYTKQKKIIGSSGFMNEDLINIFRLVLAKKVKPVIDSIYTLEKTSKALEQLESRNVFGKILIKVK